MSQDHVDLLKRGMEAFNRRDWDAALELVAGTILARVRLSGRGTASGVEVETEYAQLWTLRWGLAVRVDSYADVAEALEAAGLSE